MSVRYNDPKVSANDDLQYQNFWWFRGKVPSKIWECIPGMSAQAGLYLLKFDKEQSINAFYGLMAKDSYKSI